MLLAVCVTRQSHAGALAARLLHASYLSSRLLLICQALQGRGTFTKAADAVISHGVPRSRLLIRTSMCGVCMRYTDLAMPGSAELARLNSSIVMHVCRCMTSEWCASCLAIRACR